MYKRVYVKPETEVVELKVQGQLLDGSPTGQDGTGDEGNLGN